MIKYDLNEIKINEIISDALTNNYNYEEYPIVRGLMFLFTMSIIYLFVLLPFVLFTGLEMDNPFVEFLMFSCLVIAIVYFVIFFFGYKIKNVLIKNLINYILKNSILTIESCLSVFKTITFYVFIFLIIRWLINYFYLQIYNIKLESVVLILLFVICSMLLISNYKTKRKKELVYISNDIYCRCKDSGYTRSDILETIRQIEIRVKKKEELIKWFFASAFVFAGIVLTAFFTIFQDVLTDNIKTNNIAIEKTIDFLNNQGINQSFFFNIVFLLIIFFIYIYVFIKISTNKDYIVLQFLYNINVIDKK